MPEGKTYTSEQVALLLEHMRGKNDPRDKVAYDPSQISALVGSAEQALLPPPPPALAPGERVMKDGVQWLPEGSRVVSTPTTVFEPQGSGLPPTDPKPTIGGSIRQQMLNAVDAGDISQYERLERMYNEGQQDGQDVGSMNPMQELGSQAFSPAPEVGSQNPMQEGRGSSYAEPRKSDILSYLLNKSRSMK